MYSYLEDKAVALKSFFAKVYSGVADALSEKVYVLFESISSPYRLSAVNISASSSAMPDWYYFPDTYSFVEWMPGSTPKNGPMVNGDTYNLPILSMDILEGEDVVYDLTDFVSSVKVHTYSMDALPSIAHLLGAWSLHSHLVLDRERDFKIRIIDTNAKTLYLPFDNYDFMPLDSFEVELTGEVIAGPLDAVEHVETPAEAPVEAPVEAQETTT